MVEQDQEDRTTGEEEVTLNLGSNHSTMVKLNISCLERRVTVDNLLALPELLNLENFARVHSAVKQMFSKLKIPSVPLAGRLKHFLPAWEILTQDKQVLSLVRGVCIPFFVNSNSRKNSAISKSKQTKRFNIIGSARDVEKRSSFQSEKLRGGIYKQCVFGPEKRWETTPSHKFEGTESFHSLRALQDGRLTLFKRYSATRRLHVQNRLEGCIFQRFFGYRFTEVCSFFMARRSLRIQLSMLRSSTRPTLFHKIVEGTCCSSSKAGHQISNLSRRPSHSGVLRRGSDSGKGYNNICIATLGLCDKSKEMCNVTSTEDNISGPGSKFEYYDFSIDSRKVVKSKVPMFSFACKSKDVNIGVNKINRTVVLDCSSSHASQTTISISSTTTNSGFEEISDICDKHRVVGYVSERVVMVDREPKFVKWASNYSDPGSGSVTDRCIQEGLGCILSRNQDRGFMVEGREGSSHKRPGTISYKICNPVNSEDEESFLFSHSSRQHDSIVIPVEDGRNNLSFNDENSKRDLGISLESRDHDYCRVPSRYSEHRSRLGVQAHPRLFGMEIMPTSVQANLQQDRDSKNRPVCVKAVSAASELFCMETRPLLSRSGCNAAEVASTSTAVCIPSLFSNQQNYKEDQAREDININYDNARLADPSMVSSTTKVIKTKFPFTSAETKSFERTVRSTASTSREQNVKTSCLDTYRGNMLSEGVSGRAADLIISARRKGTNSSYSSAWYKWSSWCSEKQIDPFRCNIKWILDFLANLYEKGYEYSTICFHRSAISAFHDRIQGKPVGEHPFVSALITGIFNERPPQPKYTFIWDV